MGFNFNYWLEAFTQYLNGQSHVPPVPPPQMQQNKASPQQNQPNSSTEEIYFLKKYWQKPEYTARITLTEEEAFQKGWRFRRKNEKRAKITHYYGNEPEIIVPSQIGPYVINEIGASVFEKKITNCVRIPETVHKIGAYCFRYSPVKKIVVSAPVTMIPNGFAYSCKSLSTVQLSDTVREIGYQAFQECRCLKELKLPPYPVSVGWNAFFRSGLRDISCGTYSSFDGTAFDNTPLFEHYQMLAVKVSDTFYRIVMIGKKVQTLKLPPIKVHFLKNSILNRKDGLKSIDCSCCTGVSFETNAIQHSYSSKFGRVEREPLQIILPQNTDYVFAGGNVDLQYANGKPFPSYLTRLRSDDTETVYQINLTAMPMYSVNPDERCVRILPQNGSVLNFTREAVFGSDLERIVFEAKLHGRGALFHDACRKLHCVQWKAEQVSDGSYTVYLPSAALIGEQAHWYLLKAFSGGQKQWTYILFRHSIFDKMFRKQDNTGVPTHTTYGDSFGTWEISQWEKAGIPCLRQRQKIVLAADVLRSTASLFPNREMYRKYLLTHRRYAQILCKTLPREYADFLHEFYQAEC